MAVALTGVLLAVALVAAIRLIRERSGRQALALIVPTSWLLVPAILALAAGLVGEPIELSRAAILLIPALALLLGWGFWRPSLPRGAGLATLGALLALRALQIVPTYGVSPEDWHAATDYVLAATRVGPGVRRLLPRGWADAVRLLPRRLGGGGRSDPGASHNPVVTGAAVRREICHRYGTRTRWLPGVRGCG